MKTIVAGSRSITDISIVRTAIENCGWSITEIVSGGANGVDKIGELLAKEKSIPLKIFPADWDLHGKKAGHFRNSQMAYYADALVLVWNGKSRGSADMLHQAKQRGLRVYVQLEDSLMDLFE